MKGVGILLDNNYDLIIQVRRDAQGKISGGLSVGDVTYQNQALLLLAHKGEFKENPTAGVGITDMVNDNDFALWKREIANQIEGDGQRITRLSLDEKGLVLEASYTD
jgi:hypothetical protein